MNKLRNMMIGIALGDAFGAGYEFAFKKSEMYQDVELDRYCTHPKPEFNHKPGMYTDDTQMSIAVAELLASEDEFSMQNLAEYFVNTFKRDPIKGYAKGFQAFLESVSDGEEFLSRIKPYSERNGAAMRAVPIGIVENLDELVQYATINASLTHNTPKGIASSIATALISHYNLYYGRNPETESELISHIENVDLESASYFRNVSEMKRLDAKLLLGPKHKNKGVPCDGMRTVGAVMHILNSYDNPKNVLVESVRLGGDTDSVASISLGIHMMNKNLEDIPEKLYEGLTNHEYGKDYLLKLGDVLEEKFPTKDMPK